MISVLLSTAGNDPERRENLIEVLHCLKKQSYKNWELILVEQTLDGNFYNDQLPCTQYIPVQDPKNRGYNASWGRNIGAKAAKGDRLLFLDADIIFDTDYLEKVAAFKGDPFFIASSSIAWSKPKHKAKYLKKRNLKKVLHQSDILYKSIEGTMPINIALGFEKKWYLKTFGGYIENFFRHGLEDGEAIKRVLQCLEKKFEALHTVKEATIGHLHHSYRDRRYSQLNKQVWKTYAYESPKILRKALKKVKVGNPKHPSLLGKI